MAYGPDLQGAILGPPRRLRANSAGEGGIPYYGAAAGGFGERRGMLTQQGEQQIIEIVCPLAPMTPLLRIPRRFLPLCSAPPPNPAMP